MRGIAHCIAPLRALVGKLQCWSPCLMNDACRLRVLICDLPYQGSKGLSTAQVVHRRGIVGPNKIDVHVNGWLRSFSNEFFSFFYLYQFSTLWVWFGFFYWPTGVALVLVIVISGCVKIFVKRKGQLEVKKMAERCSGTLVLVSIHAYHLFWTFMLDKLWLLALIAS